MIYNNEETWKPAQYYQYGGGLVDLSERYEVSNKGNIRYTEYWKNKWKNCHDIPYIDGSRSGSGGKRDYRCVICSVNGTGRRFKIARMILSTFSPREDAAALEVDHIDLDYVNDDLSNLTWVTSEMNMKRRKKNG